MVASEILRRARAASGLSLRQLAARAGTSHATLSAYEHATKAPSVDTFARVLHAAGYALTEPRARTIVVDPHTGLDRGEELAEVLELAAQFPARHSHRLDAPVFGPR